MYSSYLSDAVKINSTNLPSKNIALVKQHYINRILTHHCVHLRYNIISKKQSYFRPIVWLENATIILYVTL